MTYDYDVIVIGGGHAGVEAARAGIHEVAALGQCQRHDAYRRVAQADKNGLGIDLAEVDHRARHLGRAAGQDACRPRGPRCFRGKLGAFPA